MNEIFRKFKVHVETTLKFFYEIFSLYFFSFSIDYIFIIYCLRLFIYFKLYFIIFIFLQKSLFNSKIGTIFLPPENIYTHTSCQNVSTYC